MSTGSSPSIASTSIAADVNNGDSRSKPVEWITAAQAISWIAFGKMMTADDLEAAEERRLGMFGDRFGRSGSQLPNLLTALKARSAKAPFCAVSILSESGPHSYGDKPLSPRGPDVLRHLRARFRHAQGTHVAYADIAACLGKAIAEQARANAALDQAQDKLAAAVIDGKVTARGRPAQSRDRPNNNAVHRLIDGLLLLGPRTITLYGWLREDQRLPIAEIVGCHDHCFDKVELRSSDVRRIAPLAASEQRRSGEGAQARADRCAVDFTEQLLASTGKKPKKPLVMEHLTSTLGANVTEAVAKLAYGKLPTHLRLGPGEKR